jgi:ribosome biogenesis GTPase / thiamine phosphate phosphatase
MEEKGQVIKSTGNLYTIIASGKEKVDCKLTGRYRLEDLKSTNPVTVGDWVLFERVPGEKIGRIKEVLERKNYIIRRSSNLSKTYQIIAANIDQLFLMVTVDYPKTFPEFIDRYLVTAEAYNIPSIIIFNKIDLYNQAQLDEVKQLTDIYNRIGYTCYSICALDKSSLEVFPGLFNKQINLIAGNSGVGKSTLLNTLFPELNLKINEISDLYKKGKHTTTFAEMFPLPGGGFVIDSPGIKGFGLTDMEYEPLFHYFPEFFTISRDCKFHNCLHINEPGCAVIKALEDGKISHSRYNSYVSLLDEQNQSDKYRK